MLDISNAFRNSKYPNYISCSSLMDNLLPGLKRAIDESIEVSFDTYLQFDSFQRLTPGTTFNYMKKIFSEIDHQHIKDYCEYQHRFEEDCSSHFLELESFDEQSGINLLTDNHLTDCSKISIIYS